MAYLISNIPYFKVWVRKEFTHNHNKYEGEFVHGLAIAVTTMPDRCLSFQIVFTGSEVDGTDEPNALGGAMWARMPITALCIDGFDYEDHPEKMETHIAQPWDCPSYHHLIVSFDRCKPSTWLAKLDGKFYQTKYITTIDFCESEIANSPDQHKQSHLMYVTEPGKWFGNLCAVPNNRVRVSSPALWELGKHAPDFCPSQQVHCAEEDSSYQDPNYVFNNLYSDNNDGKTT